MDGDALKGQTEIGELKELVEFLKANEVAEFGLEKEGLKVRLKFQGAESATAGAPAFDYAQLARLLGSAPAAPLPVSTVAAAAEPPAAAPPPTPPAASHHIVKSPIVGTFYQSPSPDAAPYVKIGDIVSVGQTLCIVEAMKLMNEIEADMAGEIVERIAASGEPVEYGQALFAIKPR